MSVLAVSDDMVYVFGSKALNSIVGSAFCAAEVAKLSCMSGLNTSGYGYVQFPLNRKKATRNEIDKAKEVDNLFLHAQGKSNFENFRGG